jgi:hypothetical protein
MYGVSQLIISKGKMGESVVSGLTTLMGNIYNAVPSIGSSPASVLPSPVHETPSATPSSWKI